ncbi:MerR family transcriptional regulator [Listeria floridensis]|uniref:MerR family transcriptional regulator n=1 Tax=Listeria floridensis TaxID=1494962 RepID=UPI0004B3D8A4|nr:MerR family transcriptional regulator [Listeria floridensis]
MFRIGDFSRLAQVSIRMLRHYDKLDLLKPVSIDPDSSYRYYEAKQLHDVKQIQLLQSMGFELKEIKIILASRNEAAELVQIYEKRYQNLLQQAEKIRSQLVRLQEAKPFFETTDDYLVEVKTLPARKVASCRGKIPTYQAEEQLWQQLYEALQRDAVKPSSTLQLDIAVFHDETYQDAFPDIEVQTVISDLGTSDQTITYKKST